MFNLISCFISHAFHIIMDMVLYNDILLIFMKWYLWDLC